MRVEPVPTHTLSTMTRTLVAGFRATPGFGVPGSLQMPDACTQPGGSHWRGPAYGRAHFPELPAVPCGRGSRDPHRLSPGLDTKWPAWLSCLLNVLGKDGGHRGSSDAQRVGGASSVEVPKNLRTKNYGPVWEDTDWCGAPQQPRGGSSHRKLAALRPCPQPRRSAPLTGPGCRPLLGQLH